MIEDLQYAIEWYCEAIPATQALPYCPPVDPRAVAASLDAIDAQIAPLVLPVELRWLWQTWEVIRFEMVPYPRLSAVDFAFDSWGANAGDATPRLMFPFAYESHGFLMLEMGGDPERPAPVWSYSYGDVEMTCAYPTLATLFRSSAEAVESAGARAESDDRVDRWNAYAELLRGPDFDRIVDRHFAASDGVDRRQVSATDARAWPRAWRDLAGIDPASMTPLGATHSVAQFELAAATGPVTGRLRGRWRAQGGGAFGPGGTQVAIGRLTDDTGSISLALPGSLVDLGGRDGRVDVEVDVEALAPSPGVPDLDTFRATAWEAENDPEGLAARAAELSASLQRSGPDLPIITRMIPLE